MSPAARALALEVWLGPMEGLRAVADPRSSPQLLRVGRLPFDKKTELRNHLVLSACVGVSGTHAEAGWAQGRLFVRDLGSTNGTFASEQPVTQETEIKSGDVFLVSLTGIVASIGAPVLPPPPFDPVALRGWEEPAVAELLTQAAEAAARRKERYVDTRHLAEALLRARDPGIAEVLAKAGLSAEELLPEVFSKPFFGGRESWVSEILVKSVGLPANVEGEVASPKVARLVEAARLRVPAGSAPAAWSARFRLEVFGGLVADRGGAVGRWLERKGLLPPSEAPTIHAPVGTLSGSGAAAVPSVDDTAPSLIQISPVAPRPDKKTTVLSPVDPTLDDATFAKPEARPQIPARTAPEPAAASRGRGPSVSAADVVAASAERSRPPVATGTRGGASSALRPAVQPPPQPAAPPPGPRPAHAAQPAAPAAPRAVPAPPGPAEEPEPGAPVDAVLDSRARELSAELFQIVADRRFESLDDRRKALRARLQRELAPFGKGTRRRLLEKVRVQFPVVATSVLSDAEVVRLKRRVQELEEKKPEPPTKTGRQKGEKAPAAAEAALPWPELLSGDEVPGGNRDLRVLQEVVRFALAMEMFVLGLVQSTTSPGDQTSQFRLPHTRETLRILLNQMAEGKTPSVQRVREYLQELSHWQVACLAAYHQAPKAWFERVWKRISPSQIEALPRSPGWKFRADEAEWWETYRQAVKDMGPDLVQDQVLQTASRLATEEFENLKKASEEK